MYLDFFKLMELSRRLFLLGSCLEINNQGYYIIGRAIQLHFKWYITLNDQVISTYVVDYIPTIPPEIRRAIYAKCHLGGTYEKRVLT